MRMPVNGLRLLALAACLIAAVWTPAAHAQVTTIEITDGIAVKDTVRLGINTGGDNYWDGAITKIRAAENFEGVIHRMISWGPELREDGLAVWFSPPRGAWDAMKGKVRFTLLSPPNKGLQGIVKDITTTTTRQNRNLTYLVLDRKVKPSSISKNGVLLEYEDLKQGSIRDNRNTAFWNTEGNTAYIGDVPEGTFGCAALWLKGTARPAHYAFVPMFASQADQNGTWHVKLWVKAKSGTPKFVLTGEGISTTPVPLTGEWKLHDVVLTARGMKDDERVVIRLQASDGDVLVDDVVVWKEEGDENPTAFRDHFVNLVKKLNPGTLRILQMGGSNLENNLRPPLQQYHWTRDFNNMTRGGRNNAGYYKYNLHDYYVLCEFVGADPWYCLPGTLHPEEISILMEYLGAPAAVGWGKVRAEMGHPQPWTEVFKNINIEFGNEAWNPGGYATGSFNGPGHWQDLMTAIRNSPYYSENIVLVAGSQAGSTGVTSSVLRDVPAADSYAIAPYMMNQTRAAQVAHLKTDDDLFRWAFAYAIRRVVEPSGRVFQHHALTSKAGKALSIYEHNFHLTLPTPDKGGVSMKLRNRLQASLGGGLTVINDALMMMLLRGIRVQCQFNLNQSNYRGTKLWGFAPGLNVHDQRHRPQFLAEELANRIIGGDMVRTVHAGARPTFSATGYFEDDRRNMATHGDIPALWSYAFREGKRRGLIVFNLDTASAHTVQPEFRGGVSDAGATMWLLTADSIAANNEPETPTPQVVTRESKLADFASGKSLELPPFSMTGIRWETP